MRRFLLLAHRVPLDGNFTLNDLAGGAGRMDEVARTVSTAFTLSNDLRRDTTVTVLFLSAPAPKCRRIDLDGSRLRFLNPDERSTGALLKNALVRSSTSFEPIDASPGLKVAPADPQAVIKGFAALPDTIWLEESGAPLSEWKPGGTSFGAVVSDPFNATEEEQHLLEVRSVPRISVGPRSLRSSQVVDIVHNEFDRREAKARRASGPS